MIWVEKYRIFNFCDCSGTVQQYPYNCDWTGKQRYLPTTVWGGGGYTYYYPDKEGINARYCYWPSPPYQGDPYMCEMEYINRKFLKHYTDTQLINAIVSTGPWYTIFQSKTKNPKYFCGEYDLDKYDMKDIALIYLVKYGNTTSNTSRICRYSNYNKNYNIPKLGSAFGYGMTCGGTTKITLAIAVRLRS